MAIERYVTEGEEPVSPFSQLFSLPDGDIFTIVTMGFKRKASALTIVEGIRNTLINHPRFSSILVMEGEYKGNPKWIPTNVKVEDHVIVPELEDLNIENSDECLEDYTSHMALSPMDMSKPLWEFHLLNLKTSHAEFVVMGKFHHALGDGMSLMSLLLACTRTISDPEALPTYVSARKRRAKNICLSLVHWLWSIVKLMLHTCVDVFKSIVFLCCAKDTTALLMGKPGATLITNKFIHRIIRLDDVKRVKNAMNMTINDVLFGMVQAGVSRYMNERYVYETDLETSSKSSKVLEEVSLHGVVMFNLRPNRNIEELANMLAKGSKSKWGNSIGYVLFPLEVKTNDDILDYVRQAKTIMDRKKHSFEPLFSNWLLKLTLKIGLKASKALITRIFGTTTILFTSVVGPTEEVSFFGHDISYIAACPFGLPQPFTVAIQSYASKIIINIGVDVDVIPDPHHLCDLIVESLGMMISASSK